MTTHPASRGRLLERIAVALDLSPAQEALEMARRVRGGAGWVKVGLQLFTACGGGVVRELGGCGLRVFLDLKLHDIPNTVAAAAAEATRSGADMINVHASGGLAMMRAAAEAVDREARRLGRPRPLLTAVTTLTSLDDSDLAEIGLLGPPEELVVRLAALASRAGCDGVVCSPREISSVRARCGAGFTIVTPGIRPAPPAGDPQAGAGDDQKRIATPRAALAAGADLIVLGRAVTSAADPAAVLEGILDGIL